MSCFVLAATEDEIVPIPATHYDRDSVLKAW